MSCPDKRNTNGFSLLQGAVVLFCIGILFSGITVGINLAEQTRLNSIIIDIQNYQTAFNAFVAKYQALPGDFDKASSYWRSGCVLTTNPDDCNGNGDGAISDISEQAKVWKHLSLANMIPFTPDLLSPSILSLAKSSNIDIAGDTKSIGCANGNCDTLFDIPKSIFGSIFPSSQIEGAGYTFSTISLLYGYITATNDVLGSPALTLMKYSQNQTAFGKVAGMNYSMPALSSMQAFSIDMKMDDGVFSNGNATGAVTNYIRAIGFNGCNNLTDLNLYDLDSNNISCFLGASADSPKEMSQGTVRDYIINAAASTTTSPVKDKSKIDPEAAFWISVGSLVIIVILLIVMYLIIRAEPKELKSNKKQK